MKPAPAIPALSEVTPFKKLRREATPPKSARSSKIEEALKKNLSDISTPAPRKQLPNISRKQSLTRAKPQSFTPQVSAPQLEKIPATVRRELLNTPPKMTETVKELMEGLKSVTRPSTTKQASPQRTKPLTKIPPSTVSPPSEIAQQIAKLSIPDVTPVESIKKRMQVLDVQAAGNPGRSGAKPSPGKNRYLAMVEERIDRQWVALPLLASTPLVVLKFRISRSGEISRLFIAESSGNSSYDSLAQRAVQSVNPLPSFPLDVSESFFDVQYRFIKD
jgi:TonB family protein